MFKSSTRHRCTPVFQQCPIAYPRLMKEILDDMKRKPHLRPNDCLGMIELSADVLLRTAFIGHINSSKFSSNLRVGRGVFFFSLRRAYVDAAKRSGVVIAMQYHWRRIKCIQAFWSQTDRSKPTFSGHLDRRYHRFKLLPSKHFPHVRKNLPAACNAFLRKKFPDRECLIFRRIKLFSIF
jgi:hypothetical protein